MSLEGKRVLVTRGEEQAAEACALIRARGGVPVLFPTVRIVPAADPGPLDAALAALSTFDGILFASANAARFFAERAARRGVAALPPGTIVASVGPGTSRELRARGFAVGLEARRHTAEGLAEALGEAGLAARRFLLPRAREGRDVLPARIEALGGSVVAVTAYENALPEPDEAAAAAVAADPPDVCTFASPSAFRNFFRLMGEKRAEAVLARSRVAVIGEVTARAVAARGRAADIVPKEFTLPGMIAAIEADAAPAARASKEERR